MPTIRVPNGILTVPDQHEAHDSHGKLWRWEVCPALPVPWPLRKDGKPYKRLPGERSRFWQAVANHEKRDLEMIVWALTVGVHVMDQGEDPTVCLIRLFGRPNDIYEPAEWRLVLRGIGEPGQRRVYLNNGAQPKLNNEARLYIDQAMKGQG